MKKLLILCSLFLILLVAGCADPSVTKSKPGLFGGAKIEVVNGPIIKKSGSPIWDYDVFKDMLEQINYNFIKDGCWDVFFVLENVGNKPAYNIDGGPIIPEFTYYDAAGEKIDYRKRYYVGPATLYPGEKIGYIALVCSSNEISAKVNNMQWEEGEGLNRNRDVQSISCNITQEGLPYLRGEVKNTGSKGVNNVGANILLYDSNGTILDFTYISPEPDVLKPGDTATYEEWRDGFPRDRVNCEVFVEANCPTCEE